MKFQLFPINNKHYHLPLYDLFKKRTKCAFPINNAKKVKKRYLTTLGTEPDMNQNLYKTLFF